MDRRRQHLPLPVAAQAPATAPGRRSPAPPRSATCCSSPTRARTSASRSPPPTPTAPRRRYSQEVGPVADAPPYNTRLPVVTGTLARGSLLTATTGTWTGANNLYTYQWQRDAGSRLHRHRRRDQEHLPAAEGRRGRPHARRRHRAPTSTTPSPRSRTPPRPVAAAPPVNTILPVITGMVARTKPLTATQGTWTGPNNVYTYQWQRDTGSGFTDIAGATSMTYVLTADDVGANVRIKVTATNVDATVAAYSLATVTVGSAPPALAGHPGRQRLPRRPGRPCRPRRAAWSPTGFDRSPTSGRPTWAAAGVDLAGATAAHLRADRRRGRRRRSAPRSPRPTQDGSTVAYSNALGPVVATPVNTVEPDVTGTLTDNEVLTATTGTWASAGDLTHTYKYQWVRCPASAVTTTRLQLDRRRRRLHLHDAHRRRRLHGRRQGHRHQLAGRPGRRELRADRRHPGPRAGQHHPAGDRRPRAACARS